MLSWALMFLIVAIIAGVFGSGVMVGAVAWIAKVHFLLFLIAFVVALIIGRRVLPVS